MRLMYPYFEEYPNNYYKYLYGNADLTIYKLLENIRNIGTWE